MMNYDQIMELNNVTVQDCIDMYRMKGMVTICNDGKVVGFEKEEEREW